MLFWHHSGKYAVKVAGASHYRDALKDVAQNPKGVPSLLFCDARLELDNANPYDTNAISVWIQDRKAGHIPRDLAPELRAAIASIGASSTTSYAAASVSGGLETADRHYEYVVELDIALPCSLDTASPRSPSEVKRINSYPTLELQPDGSYTATVWLPVASHDKLHRKRKVMTWTTDDWPVVCIYAVNSQQLGLGYKLTEIDKATFARIFGDKDVEGALIELNGRFARLSIKTLPQSSDA